MTTSGRRQRSAKRCSGIGGNALALVLFLAAVTAAPGAEAKLGEGFKIGPGRLKLGLELSGRYDSMAVGGSASGSGTTIDNPGDGIGLARGTFALDVPGEFFTAKLSGGIDWNQYLGLNADTSGFSFLGANITGGLNVNPKGSYGLDVTENLTRSDRTNNPVFAVGVLGLSSSTKMRGWGKPGGGAIEFGLNYELGLDVYSAQVAALNGATYKSCPDGDLTCNPEQASAFNAMLNRVGFDAKWRLLPKTGVTLEANYGWKSYLAGSAVASAQDASPLRVFAGFGTLLTTRLTFNVKLGYGAVLFSGGGATRHNFLAQTEVGYRFTEQLSGRIGYSRFDEPVSSAALYYSDDRAFMEFRGQFNRFVATATASLDYLGYGGTQADRKDFNVGVTGLGEYHFNDWLLANLRLGLSARSTSLSSGSSAYDYVRWEGGLGAAVLF